MNEWMPFIALSGLIVAVAGLIVGLFAWLRQDIKALSDRVDKKIQALSDRTDKNIQALSDRTDKNIQALGERADKQDGKLDHLIDRMGKVEQGLATLKATVETFFRVRIDPPPPPPSPPAEQPRTGTEG